MDAAILDILKGRKRKPGLIYKQSGMVCSTAHRVKRPST